MKTNIAALLVALLVGGSLVTANANAAGGHFRGGGHFHGGGFHHGARVGVFVGVAPPLFYSPYYYPRYYYPPAVVVPGPVAAAPVYIEQQPPLGEPGPPAVGAPPAAGNSLDTRVRVARRALGRADVEGHEARGQVPPVPGAPPAAGNYWYYCRDSQTYYPYVQECASPWDRVAPNSAPPA